VVADGRVHQHLAGAQRHRRVQQLAIPLRNHGEAVQVHVHVIRGCALWQDAAMSPAFAAEYRLNACAPADSMRFIAPEPLPSLRLARESNWSGPVSHRTLWIREVPCNGTTMLTRDGGGIG
jgi:hypothetical protein